MPTDPSLGRSNADPGAFVADAPERLTSPVLADPAAAAGARGVRHGFFTRRGGVSRGVLASLNTGLGADDDRAAVIENRRRCMAALGAAAEALVAAYQVHGADVVTVERPWPSDARPEADALVTDRPGLALGILTADCAPILFADAEAGVVGAAHAGWKGALAGVAAATVDAMAALGADPARIHAAVGPAIRQESYEVGPEFRERFAAAEPESLRFFAPASAGEKHLFDLPGYVAARLRALDLGAVDVLDADTCADAARFFSYRRATRRGEPDYGRQLSAIMLAP